MSFYKIFIVGIVTGLLTGISLAGIYKVKSHEKILTDSTSSSKVLVEKNVESRVLPVKRHSSANMTPVESISKEYELLINSVARMSLREIKETLKGLGNTLENNQLRELLLTKWGHLEPESALIELSSNPQIGYFYPRYIVHYYNLPGDMIVKRWIMRNPDKAIAFLVSEEGSKLKTFKPYIESACEQLLHDNPSQLESLVPRLSKYRLSLFINRSYKTLLENDPPILKALMSHLPIKDQLSVGNFTFKDWRQKDPQSAKEWVKSLPQENQGEFIKLEEY